MDTEERSDIEARIAYLRAALTPGTETNAMTTFYVGKGDEMRAEIKRLTDRLSTAGGAETRPV